MVVPKFDDLFNPLLRALHELKGSATVEKVEEKVASILNLTQKEVKEIHRGNRTTLNYRLAWASNYLKRYGLIDKSKRGVWSLTEKGKTIKQVDKEEVTRTIRKIEQEKTSQKLGEKGLEPLNMKEFLPKIDLDKFRYEAHYLENPGVRVKDILSNVETDWVLPNFQRYYDWEKEDVRAFLESIFNDYFVGSLLLWKVEKDPGIATFPIEGVKSEIKKPKIIILDGQQRITSLYYAIKAPELKDDKIKSYFYVHFRNFFENPSRDLVISSRRKYGIKESVELMLFPFFELENHISWFREFEDFHEKDGADRRKLKDLIRIMQDRMIHVWQHFQIPDIKLPASMKLRHVVDIFENLNTKGKPLDSFDLLIAASSKHNIDLRKLWEAASENYPELRRYSKKTSNKLRMYIIQAISLLYNPTSSCKRSDILELYEQVYEAEKGKDAKIFVKHWDEMSKYVYLAIKKLEDLKDGFGVVNEDHVSFMSVIPIMAALIKEVDSRDNKHECNRKLKQWYWSVVFSEAYSSSVDSQLTSDFKELKEWFVDDSKIPKNVESARASVQALNLRRVSTLSSAIFKGVLSILALKGSRDLQTGEMVNERNNYHKDHIFPKSKAERYAPIKKEIDSILNMAWLTESTNENKKAKDPKQYFEEFVRKFKGKKEEYFSVLESHLINKPAYDCLLSNDFEGFLNERETLFKEQIKKLIGWSESDLLEEQNENISELLSSYESEKLEFKSTFKSNLETDIPDENLKFSILKTIAGFLNSKGGTLVIGYDEKNRKIIGLEKDYELSKRKDRDSFELEFWAYLESNIEKEIVKKNVQLRFETVEEKDIAVVEVKRSKTPVYLKKNEKKILHVRSRNETEPLDDPEEIHNYIEKHF